MFHFSPYFPLSRNIPLFPFSGAKNRDGHGFLKYHMKGLSNEDGENSREKAVTIAVVLRTFSGQKIVERTIAFAKLPKSFKNE